MDDFELKFANMHSEFYMADPKPFLDHAAITAIIDRLQRKNIIVNDSQTLISLDDICELNEKKIQLSVSSDYERNGLSAPHQVRGHDLRCFDKEYFLQIVIQNLGIKPFGRYKDLNQINAYFQCNQYHNTVDVLELQNQAISAVHKVYDKMLDKKELQSRRRRDAIYI